MFPTLSSDAQDKVIAALHEVLANETRGHSGEGGSKRIPRKNIKLFAGKPMIAWSIEAAQRTGLFDRIVVSTDDEEIASIARKYGADVPFVRPAELSDDYTGTAPVIAHAIEWHLKRDLDLIEVCCIYATAPFFEVKI